MKDLLLRALDTARARGASYADVRLVRRQVQTLLVKNGRPEKITRTESTGFGVRALVHGAWGFSSSSDLHPEEWDRVAAQAADIARASALTLRSPVDLGEPLKIVATYRTPIKTDPLKLSLEQKMAPLIEASRIMQGVKGIGVADASAEVFREDKTFASTEGSYIEQELTETGCGIEATAVGQGDVQRRSYPSSIGRHQGTEGWEFVERQDLLGNAQRIAEEAVALLTAKPCPSGITTTIILDGSQTALQMHESCGHAVELDRVLGTEAAFAGTSFLTLDRLGTFRYGSPLVHITADATLPGGLGTFGYDDEGVPASRRDIIRDGVLAGYLSSRETARVLGQASSGAARADGWGRIPLVRMTNVNLEPGTWRFEDLIADTDDGIYLQTNRSWSIDDRRLNFQFGTEIAWEIKKGKLGAMLKNATYTGITYQFWNSCDAICNRDHWLVWGTPNCGKGQPEQVAHVGHGAAPARFRNVRVGILKQ